MMNKCLENVKVKKKRYEVRLTDEQDKELSNRINAMGFSSKSDYIRFIVFMEFSFIDKINQIHKMVCTQNVR